MTGLNRSCLRSRRYLSSRRGQLFCNALSKTESNWVFEKDRSRYFFGSEGNQILLAEFWRAVRQADFYRLLDALHDGEGSLDIPLLLA
jgi:hypothetical protein